MSYNSFLVTMMMVMTIMIVIIVTMMTMMVMMTEVMMLMKKVLGKNTLKMIYNLRVALSCWP